MGLALVWVLVLARALVVLCRRMRTIQQLPTRHAIAAVRRSRNNTTAQFCAAVLYVQHIWTVTHNSTQDRCD